MLLSTAPDFLLDIPFQNGANRVEHDVGRRVCGSSSTGTRRRECRTGREAGRPGSSAGLGTRSKKGRTRATISIFSWAHRCTLQ
jgi:hypothetical protein